jgi:hypothetical protein
MTTRRHFLAGSAASLAALASRPLSALDAGDPSRIALVIGNDRYALSPLGNAANDARSMAELLKSAGFRVDARTDASSEALSQAVSAFGEAIARPEVKLAIFYYAGHGVQVDWRNYLLPVDANIASSEDLKRQCLDLGVLLASLGKAQGKEYVIVLDACRDNPFGTKWRPEQRGLSQFDAPVGSLIAFSTAPGSVASDGGGQHGLYTENLVRELAVKGTRIEDALKRVRLNVRLASQGAQIPWESTSLEGDVFIFPQQAQATAQDDERRFEEELARWNALKGSRNSGDWAAFLRDYPDGKFSEIAQARLNAMLAMRERAGTKAGTNRGIIQIDAQHAVPASMGKSANPYSAGTYALDRLFAVGDQATYQDLDPDGRVRRTYTARVTRVDAGADRVEYNGGNVVSDLLGNPLRTPLVEYDAPVQVNPAELQVGKRWQARYHASKRGGEADVEMQFEIVARERVVVPAGEFDAFRIEGRGRQVGGADADKAQRFRRRDREGTRRTDSPPIQVTVWDVPGLNFVVKRVTVTQHRNRPAGNEHIELVSLKQGGGLRS